MAGTIKVLNPLDVDHWDELVMQASSASFFHSAAWAKVLVKSYGYIPRYFTCFDGKKLSALLPLMAVESCLTGKRGVSLPFSDHCEPIIQGGFDPAELHTAVLRYAKEQNWKYVEWRGVIGDAVSHPASVTYLRHLLDISPSEEMLFSGLRASTRRNIKKASKEGVSIEFSHSWDAVAAFYRLNSLTRKRHGIPPQPYGFFEKLFAYVVAPGQGVVSLAKYQEKIIAAAMFLQFGDTILYKYGASDSAYQHLRANNLIMWEAIKWSQSRAGKLFDFGRTDAANQGLLQFKRGWGAGEENLVYFKYDLQKAAFVSESQRAGAMHHLFRKMPVPLLNLAGNLLYRHVG